MNIILDYLLRNYEMSDYKKQRKVIVLTILTTLLLTFTSLYILLDNIANNSIPRKGIIQVLMVLFLLLGLILTQKGHLRLGVNAFLLFTIIINLYFYYESFYWVVLMIIPMMFLIINVVRTNNIQLWLYGLIIASNIIYILINNASFYENSFNELLIAITFLVFAVGFIYIFIERVQKEIEESHSIIDKSTVDFVLKSNSRRRIDIDKHKEDLSDTVSILMIGINDIDKISISNDHEEMNLILKEVMNTIRNTVRLDDYIIRWGQSEFLVMLHYTKLSNSGIVGEKIRRAIEFKSFGSNKDRITVTICATAKNEESKIQVAIERASEGLKKAQSTSKNSVVFP